jgi:uncharacterized membrane protein
VFIRHIMPPDPSFGLSPIHVFVQIMLSGVVGALFGAWTHNIRVHRGTTIGTCIGGLLTAGACVPARPNHAYDCVELT